MRLVVAEIQFSFIGSNISRNPLHQQIAVGLRAGGDGDGIASVIVALLGHVDRISSRLDIRKRKGPVRPRDSGLTTGRELNLRHGNRVTDFLVINDTGDITILFYRFDVLSASQCQQERK